MYVLDPKSFGGYEADSVSQFVKFWEQFYRGDDKSYLAALNLNADLTEDNLINLLRWKSPRMLTHRRQSDGQKNPRVERVLQHALAINSFRNGDISADEFEIVTVAIFPSGIIWQLFLFHVARPVDWPIADQHVFRSYSKLFGRPAPNSIQTFPAYADSFNLLARQFFTDLKVNSEDHYASVAAKKRLDNALVAFGQFLAKYDQ